MFGGPLAGLVAGTLAAAAADHPPAPDGRALYSLVDPSFEGNGPGGALFVDGRNLGSPTSTLGATAVVGWTVRPVRLAVAFPADIGADRVAGVPPRLDLLFVLHDRKRGGLGVAGGLDAPFPFVLPEDPTVRARLAFAVGMEDTVVSVNLGAPIGPPMEAFTWSVGGALPIVGPLGGFAELDGMAAIGFDPPKLTRPGVSEARAGLHLSPPIEGLGRPLVLKVAVAGRPGSAFPSLSVGAAWIPPKRAPAPRTEALDSDKDHVANAVDACPREREDFDGGNDADGCPDGGGQRTSPTRDVTP